MLAAGGHFAAILASLVAWAVYHVLLSPQGPVMHPSPSARLSKDAILAQPWEDKAVATALVTGGSSGIGKAMALDLLKRGFSVVFTATSHRTLQAALEDLKAKVALKPGQTVEGRIMDVTRPGQATDVLNKVFAERDLRVVIYQAFPEVMKPLYHFNSSEFESMVYAMGTVMADGALTSIKSWMRRNVTGTFIGTSSIATHAYFPAAELYASLRTFQTTFLTKTAHSLMSQENMFADERTRQILVACIETPFVWTPILERSRARKGSFLEWLVWASWDVNVFASTVLHSVLDQGHSFVAEGPGWRLARLVSHVFPVSIVADGGADTPHGKRARGYIAA